MLEYILGYSFENEMYLTDQDRIKKLKIIMRECFSDLKDPDLIVALNAKILIHVCEQRIKYYQDRMEVNSIIKQLED